MSTPADYAWFETDFPELAEAYCFTAVRAIDPPGLLAALSAEPLGETVGVLGADEAAHAVLEDGLQYAAVTRLGEWALMLEPNGHLGVSDAVGGPLSHGRRAVAHFRNVNAADHFRFWDDGVSRLDFEPLFAAGAEVSADLLPELRAAGFDLDPEGAFGHHSAAAFVLAERLTALPVTPGLLTRSRWTCGLVPIPR
ncbi:hypothetical protein Afil01_12610 [Actinorhabdospora filicis]|uniref:Uncharacterized protein n=1 Tax=Actinorhabdospora filicis TaxID=1785913 RepID=A0A9W6SFZ7_9ACTN|nr:DUF6461 domain-containing protein [Actinorhabdospora filicis]GLZ76454.1 hypothetical protein Afil01_12610 [Actinorhabdospora filicis]